MRLAWVATLVVTLLAASVVPGAQGVSRRPIEYRGTARLEAAADGSMSILVEPGNEPQATAYYQDIAAALPGLDVPKSTLQTVLDYMGYRGLLLAANLEQQHPDTIMNPFPSGDVLATRFFAPKITAVATPVPRFRDQPPPVHLGWRKLVRVQARAGSGAASAGISAMFLLFNIFQLKDQVSGDPFALSPSVNNQVILVRAIADQQGRRAYWLMYGPGRSYPLTKLLCASFDGDVAPPRGPCPPGAEYYVPAACVQCHGGRVEREMLNYLDTDHWNDRVQDGDDFVFLRKNSLHGVLFDGGRDSSTGEFRRAFRVIRQLNAEIRSQNCGIAAASFQCRAVENWLKRHQATIAFLPPIERPIPSAHAAGPTWQGPADAALLTDLNRFCFRCHSSLAYHVFDKGAVLARRSLMIPLIKRGMGKHGMPQDRELDEDTKNRLVDRLERLTD